MKDITSNPRKIIKPLFLLKHIRNIFYSIHISEIYPEELLNKVMNKTSSSKLIDIRSNEDYYGKLGHIKGAESFPLLDLIDDVNMLKDYKNKEIILICEIGRSSKLTAHLLAHTGYKTLRNLVGGMTNWYRKGYPTIKEK